MAAFAMVRITDATALVAQDAQRSGEQIEFKDRHGVLHRGFVRGIEYQLGINQGWFVALELVSEQSTLPVLMSKGEVS